MFLNPAFSQRVHKIEYLPRNYEHALALYKKILLKGSYSCIRVLPNQLTRHIQFSRSPKIPAKHKPNYISRRDSNSSPIHFPIFQLYLQILAKHAHVASMGR